MKSGAPGVALGTLNFVYPHGSSTLGRAPAARIVERFLRAAGGGESGPAVIDTASYYGRGATEALLGAVLHDDLGACHGADYVVWSKANPWRDHDFSSGEFGGLGAGALKAQVRDSLAGLRLPALDLLYLHAWDYATPPAETLEACADLYRTERIAALGVSNFSAANLAAAVEARDALAEGTCPRISHYQGMYNAACRGVEPVVRACHAEGIAFQAYNPLAGGLLTGRYGGLRTPEEVGRAGPSRFAGNAIYQGIFWRPPLLEFCAGLSARASLAWLAHRSLLDAGDRVVVGCSSVEQLDENLGALAAPAPARWPPALADDALYAALGLAEAAPAYHY